MIISSGDKTSVFTCGVALECEESKLLYEAERREGVAEASDRLALTSDRPSRRIKNLSGPSPTSMEMYD